MRERTAFNPLRGREPRGSITAIVALTIVLGGALPCVAGETGTPGFQDARIKTHLYDASEVYRIIGHFGFVTSIQFEDGEVIESVQLGDSVSWSVERLARGDMLSVVPIDEAARGTNMTVTTNARVYVFDMIARHAATPDAPEMTFLYRFDYPITAEELAAEAEARAARGAKITSFDDVIERAREAGETLNAAYRASGDLLLRPSAMIDDGAKTYLRFERGASRPAVFAVAPSGDEASVNTSTLEDGTLVIHQTGRAFTLRGRDGSTVCIFNDRMITGYGEKPPSIMEPAALRASSTGDAPNETVLENADAALPARMDRAEIGGFIWEHKTADVLASFEGFDGGALR